MADVPLYTVEDLKGIKTDAEVEKKVAQSLLLPVGTYNSQPELTLTIREGGPESQHPGRKSASFYGFFKGAGQVREEAPEGERPQDQPLMDPQPAGRAGFDLSWEYRDKVDFETKEVQIGEPDNQSKLWHLACNLYRLVNQLPKGTQLEVPDVLEYLRKYSVAVRFMKGDTRNIALAISRAKEG